MLPKSNSAYMGIEGPRRCMKDILDKFHLRDAHYSGAKDLGMIGYKYCMISDGRADQQYMPDPLAASNMCLRILEQRQI